MGPIRTGATTAIGATAACWELLVEPEGRSGPVNMAVDAALLREARRGRAFLRIYRFAPPCLSFGRHEPALRRYDQAAIRALGLATVRRPTGGRAVWHDDEVTYAVAGPEEMFGSLREAYGTIHEVLATALRRLGAPVGLAPSWSPSVAPGAGACFAAPVGGEIVAHGRKVVGSAQVRERGAFLQHGSILVSDGQDVVQRVTRGPARTPRAVGLREVLGRSVEFAEVASAVAAAAAHAWPGIWRRSRAPSNARERALFDRADWTWRR